MAHAIQRSQFPEACPSCAQPFARVRMAGTVLGRPTIIRVTVTCDACQHERVIDIEGEPLMSDAETSPLQEMPYR